MTMKYGMLILGTLLCGLLFGVLYVSLADNPVESGALGRLVVVNAKGLSALGAFIALFQFAPKDYLRRAWALMTIGAVLLVEADVVNSLLEPVLAPNTLGLARSILVVGANASSPVAMVLFARALTVAGLDVAGTRGSRVAWTLVAVVVSVVVAGPGVVDSFRGLEAGNMRSLATVASGLGDMVSLVLLAPLIYVVITLRGGALFWPFMLLAASILSWLVYDGAGMIAGWAGRPEAVVPLQQCCRVWACMFLFSAGLAQRWVLAGAAGAAGARAAEKAA